jgi:4a-hydroxytetrahydrobiopterin dehydratase
VRHLKSYTIYESTENVSGWKNDGKSLTGEFIFQSFESARQFINQVATESELHNHHPKIEWMFDKVALTLSTHDAGDIVTEKDINLANSINGIYENN